MRVLKSTGKYFGSYPEIEFNYEDLGLGLITGATKAGKSTLLDLPCWTLYGKTSKDSAADDMKSWFADDNTEGTTIVETQPNKRIHVTRIRGKSASKNDLYYVIETKGVRTDIKRGKDITETQRDLNKEYGVDVDTFITGSYIHQFSQADSFFTANAKQRRETVDKIADMSLAVKLGEASSENRKGLKKQVEDIKTDLAKLGGRQEQAKQTEKETEIKIARWNTDHATREILIKGKVDGFEEEKNAEVALLVTQLETLDPMIKEASEFDTREKQLKTQIIALDQSKKDFEKAMQAYQSALVTQRTKQSELNKLNALKGDTCPHCLGPAKNPNRQACIKECSEELEAANALAISTKTEVDKFITIPEIGDKLNKSLNAIIKERGDNQRFIDKFESIRVKALGLRDKENPYEDQLIQHQAETNPYDSQLGQYAVTLKKLKEEIAERATTLEDTEHRLNSMSQLYDIAGVLRGALMAKAVRTINEKTNEYLEKFFEASLKVNFTLESSDKLEVEILNEGYVCPYKQLSGGERCMLKLAFSFSLMKQIEDLSGIKFSLLMLDEVLNGVDSDLRVKAFNMLQSLQSDYETILIIDHDDRFKSLFENQFTVEKRGSYSEVLYERVKETKKEKRMEPRSRNLQRPSANA